VPVGLYRTPIGSRTGFDRGAALWHKERDGKIKEERKGRKRGKEGKHPK